MPAAKGKGGCMSITIQKQIDPLTRQVGFLAVMQNDAAFAFSEKDAARKLMARHLEVDFMVSWTNGSMTFYRKGEA
jgi:hypothetical protein